MMGSNPDLWICIRELRPLDHSLSF
jgi:hypothetical protein